MVMIGQVGLCPRVLTPCSINTRSLKPDHSCKKDPPFHDPHGDDEGENVMHSASCPHFRTTRSTPPTIRPPTWPNVKGCVHLITGPTQHVLREEHTVYFFGSVTPLRDLDETGHMTAFASSLGQDVLLCDVTSGQWYKRAPSDPTFTHLHASTFPVLHPRSAVLGVLSLPLHSLQLHSLFQRTQATL